MSATEIIEQIKKLSREEQEEVYAFVCKEQPAPYGTERRPADPADNAEFEEAVKWAVEEHRELLRRLAQ